MCRQRPTGEAPWATRVLRDRFPFVWKSKIIILGQILRKSEVTTNVQALNSAKGRKGKYGPNLTTKISKSEIFDFPKLAPERSWGNAGMVGHAETCSKHTPARPRLAPRFLTYMTLSRQSMGMTRKISNSPNHQNFKIANFEFS